MAGYGAIVSAGDPVTPGNSIFQSLCLIQLSQCSIASGIRHEGPAGIEEYTMAKVIYFIPVPLLPMERCT